MSRPYISNKQVRWNCKGLTDMVAARQSPYNTKKRLHHFKGLSLSNTRRHLYTHFSFTCGIAVYNSGPQPSVQTVLVWLYIDVLDVAGSQVNHLAFHITETARRSQTMIFGKLNRLRWEEEPQWASPQYRAWSPKWYWRSCLPTIACHQHRFSHTDELAVLQWPCTHGNPVPREREHAQGLYSACGMASMMQCVD